MKIVFAAMLLWCFGDAAAAVYKCTDGNGAIAFQATPCAGKQHQDDVTIRDTAPKTPEPSITPARPLWPASSRVPNTVPPNPVPEPAAPAQSAEDTSLECRNDGMVYYRHFRCDEPRRADRSLRAPANLIDAKGRSKYSDMRLQNAEGTVIPRREACKRMHARDREQRIGHELDDIATTYDKASGRDLCKGY